jgi:hypothetical protein
MLLGVVVTEVSCLIAQDAPLNDRALRRLRHHRGRPKKCATK